MNDQNRSLFPGHRKTMRMLTLTCVISLVVTVRSYSSGAPYSTCLSQFPNHYAQALTSPSPFEIRVSETSYSPGQVIMVDVSGSRSFTGLSLRARRVRGDTEEILGSFVSFPGGLVQTYNCLGGDKNLLTQTSHRSKRNVTVSWRAPDYAAGDIVFTATVVVSFTQFWVHVLSRELSDNTGYGNIGDLEPVKNSSVTLNFEEECGVVKGCFLYPETCTGSDCTAGISYQMDGDYVHFEMMGVSEGWLALGLSNDRNMGDDDVMLCTAQKTRVSIQHGYNPAYYYERQYTAGVKNMATMEKDGKIFCRFSRPLKMTSVFVTPNSNPADVNEKVFDLRRPWFLQLAWGYTFDGVDAINKHDEVPIVSAEKVDFGEFVVERGRPLPVAVKAHGCLMVIAWMLCACLAMVVSRHFRDGPGSREIFGVEIWFQGHRTIAFLVVGISLLGFIVIFAGLQRWSQEAQGHAILGIIIILSAIGQLAMGLFRPEKNASYRPCFVWLHRLLGKVTQILTAVEMILAFKIEHLSPAMREFGLPVVVVWIVAQVVWEVGLDLYRCFLQRRGIRSFVLTSQTRLDEKTLGKPNAMMSVLFVVYVTSLLALTVTALCAIIIF